MIFFLKEVLKFILFFIISVQSILTNSSSIVYTIEGSTTNLTFENTDLEILLLSFRNGSLYSDYLRLEENKYVIRIRPSIIEFQIINITSSDEGFYWLRHRIPSLQLTITSKCIVTFLHVSDGILLYQSMIAVEK